MATKTITAEDIRLINQTYYETHNKAETVRRTGFSAYMVNKHIVRGWKPEEQRVIKHFTHEQLPEFETIVRPLLPPNEWYKFALVTEEEREEMKSLWEELDA